MLINTAYVICIISCVDQDLLSLLLKFFPMWWKCVKLLGPRASTCNMFRDGTEPLPRGIRRQISISWILNLHMKYDVESRKIRYPARRCSESASVWCACLSNEPIHLRDREGVKPNVRRRDEHMLEDGKAPREHNWDKFVPRELYTRWGCHFVFKQGLFGCRF